MKLAAVLVGREKSSRSSIRGYDSGYDTS
jgi:hypothetical protein